MTIIHCKEIVISEIFDAHVFHTAIEAAKNDGKELDKINGTFGTGLSGWFGAFVYTYPEDKYKDMRKFLTTDYLGGFCLNDEDIVSVFKHPLSTQKSILNSLIPRAIQENGRRLDCIDGVLPIAYSKFDLVPVARMGFNPAYKPDDWNFARDKSPDIIYMAYQKDQAPYKNDLNKRREWVDEVIKQLPYSSSDDVENIQKNSIIN